VRTAGANSDSDCARRSFLERGRPAGAPSGPGGAGTWGGVRPRSGSNSDVRRARRIAARRGALLEPGRTAAGRLAAGTGVRVFANRYAARMACGGGRFTPQRLAYFPEIAEPMLAGLKHLILVESQPPISFFGYPGRRSYLAPEDCALHVLAPIEANGTEALEALVEECGVESVSRQCRTYRGRCCPKALP